MTRIGLLSDTHSDLNPKAFPFFSSCDELWHAGDIGSVSVIRDLEKFRPLKAVYGNIDGREIRGLCSSELTFHVENVKVLMTHIGGYPGHYDTRVRKRIEEESPNLFVCGHSHILKVIYDKKYSMLVINPGAAGNSGFHQSVTMVRFVIERANIRDLEVLDIPRG
jgi:uncharacterized protein